MSSVKELKKQIADLQAQRAEHQQAIDEIDAVFARLGIGGKPKRRRGRPKGSKNRPKA